MISTEPACYTTIQLASDSEPPTELKLKEDLENGDMKTKIEALKKTITLILNGEKMPSLLMTIIRFVLPLQVMLKRSRHSACQPPFWLPACPAVCRSLRLSVAPPVPRWPSLCRLPLG